MERSTVSFVLLNPDTFESESEPTMDLSLSQWEFREKIKACVVLPCAPAVISGTKEQVPLSRTSTMVADTIDASGEHTHTDQSNPNDSEMTGSGYTNSSVHTASPKVDSLRVMPVRRGILLDQQPNPRDLWAHPHSAPVAPLHHGRHTCIQWLIGFDLFVVSICLCVVMDEDNQVVDRWFKINCVYVCPKTILRPQEVRPRIVDDFLVRVTVLV